MKISAVISAFNEESKIKDCLESVKWADEIVFIDSGSTDKTSEIAKKYTSKIYKRPNNLMLNVNKNYGFSKVGGDWILCLDADERVTPSLRDEIKDQISNTKNNEIDGYWVPRQNIIFGKWMQHAGWYPDNQLRLLRRGAGKFPEQHVHEMIQVEGETAYLKNPLIHYNFDTISQFFHKHLDIYAPNEAQQLLKNGYQFKWQDAIRMPVREFLSRFFAREGYKDGFHGFVLSLFMAFYHLIIFGYLWEKEKFIDIEKNILSNTKEEFSRAHNEISFWYNKELLKTTHNPLKKIYYRIVERK